MAIEATSISDLENWTKPEQKSLRSRVFSGVMRFARKKPLGALCGVVILVLVIIGDLIPVTVNKVASTAGAGEPVPYLADQLADNFSFIYPYQQQDLRNRLQGSSSEHLLGTDQFGRDILSRILYGARTAITVSFIAVCISTILGIIINVPAGYFGGWYDKVMYRMVDIADSLPNLVVLLVVLGILGSGLWEMVIVIGILQGLGGGGRILRGQTISLMQSAYIEAARSIGAGNVRIMLHYLLPNIMPLIILVSTVRLGSIVLLEASLSFLGFGMAPPFPSWGQMLSLEGREYMRSAPGIAIYPGLAIGVLVFAFNLFGDALRDVLDPRLRGSR